MHNNECRVLLDPALLLKLIASSELQTPLYKHDILSLLLFADTVVVPDLLDSAFIDVFNDYSGIIRVERRSFEEIIENLSWKIEFDRVDNVLLGLLQYANTENLYFFVDREPENIEKLIEITNDYLPSYLPKLKESLLIQDILGFIISEEIAPYVTRIDAEKLKESAKILTEFKHYFQEGILEITKTLRGQYFLNDDNKRWIKQYIVQKEAALLELLKPENLRKLKLDSLVIDIISAIPKPIPADSPLGIIGIIIELARYLRAKDLLKDKGIAFVLSLMVVKKVIGYVISKIKPTNCVICALSIEEIKRMSKGEAEEVIKELFKNGQICINHMVAYLDIRKKYRYTGKKLLLAMKEYY